MPPEATHGIAWWSTCSMFMMFLPFPAWSTHQPEKRLCFKHLLNKYHPHRFDCYPIEQQKKHRKKKQHLSLSLYLVFFQTKTAIHLQSLKNKKKQHKHIKMILILILTKITDPSIPQKIKSCGKARDILVSCRPPQWCPGRGHVSRPRLDHPRSTCGGSLGWNKSLSDF